MDKVTVWKEFEYLIYNPEERQSQELLMLNSYMIYIYFFLHYAIQTLWFRSYGNHNYLH